ncbi:hypothetical protein [Streptomyces albipurpureus]|uniref:Uncharacterized protein n=1 Tax=Streptomyces albipurpureus TaxID=2897419 RepID=A0ABT0UYD2_9ACTN|nr:hypothetical protein [Streptomyces sp. CWNU-1]MCM2393582.1 hypothetical protein [Streptomyces sp. CWNU-1]
MHRRCGPSGEEAENSGHLLYDLTGHEVRMRAASGMTAPRLCIRPKAPLFSNAPART